MWDEMINRLSNENNEVYYWVWEIGLAVVILITSWVLFRLLMRGANMYATSNEMAPEVMYLFRRLMRWSFVLVTAMIVLQVVGLLENAWAAITGIFALVAIGFVAVWSVLSNTLCSIMLLITRPFAVGDRIRIPSEDLEGKVVDFNFMFTRLAAKDGSRIEVPNNMFFQKALVRYECKESISLDQQLMQQEQKADGPPKREEPEEGKKAA